MTLENTGSTFPVGGRPFNNLLRTLRNSDYALIAPHLHSAQSKTDELLYAPGDNVDVVYFPCGPSVVSYSVGNVDGPDVETTLVGREGAGGGIISFGHVPAYCRIVVKSGGPLAHLRIDNFEAAKSRSLTLRYLFARYADCLLAQTFQSAACNAIHSIEQRAANGYWRQWTGTAIMRCL